VLGVRRGIAVLGIAVPVALGLSGCGGGGSSTGERPVSQADQIREALRQTVVPELEEEMTKGQVDCIKQNIETEPGRELVEWFVVPSSASDAEAAQAEGLGPLAIGCF
jgi:ABC-type phosphate/phosphonate transport system substrate-binding protein